MSWLKTLKDKNNAKKYDLTYEQYLDYLDLNKEHYVKIEEFKLLLKNLTVKQYMDYLNVYKSQYNISNYLLYCECISIGLSYDESKIYVANFFKIMTPDRYRSYLKATQLNLSLEQYDEWMDKYKDTLSPTRFIDFCHARENHLSLEEYDEWLDSYKDSMTLNRFFDVLAAREKQLSLEEYDEWAAAMKMDLTVAQYRQYLKALALGLTLTEYEVYLKLKTTSDSGEKRYILKNFNEIRVLNLLGFKKIILDETLKSIPYRAFYGCSSFEEISLHSGVSEIGENAFENCTSLTSIIIPGAVKTIPGFVFKGCDALESIYLLDGIKTVNITGWTQLSNLSEVASTASIESFSINQSNNFYKVKSRDSDGYFREIEDVRDTVEILEVDSNIENVNDFPNLKVLMVKGFYKIKSIKNCPKLEVIIAKDFSGQSDSLFKKNIDIPNLKFLLIYNYFYNRVNCEKHIDLKTFLNQLIWLQVPVDTTKIFIESINNLKSIGVKDYRILPKSVKKGLLYNRDSDSGIPCIYEGCSNGKTYITSLKPYDLNIACKRLKVLEGVTLIKERAFRNKKMKELYLPYSLESIESEAFAKCNNLEKIYFYNIPGKIALDAFNESDMLKDVNVPNRLAFKRKYKIKNLDLSDITSISLKGMSDIPSHYASCSGLIEITFPSTIKKIGNRAFAGCIDLKKIIFKSNIEEISEDAFEGCTNVDEIVWGENRQFKIAGSTGFPKIKNMPKLEGFKEIKDGTFKNWGLQSIEFPPALNYIGREAFAGCKDLVMINGDKRNTLNVTDQIDFGPSAFLGCCGFDEVIYNCDEITQEKASLIEQCNASKIMIKDNIKFTDFNNLMKYNVIEVKCIETMSKDDILLSEQLSIQLPSTLFSLELPKCIHTLSRDRFPNCGESLEELYLSENMLNISVDFFESCLALRKLYIHSDALHLIGQSNIPKIIEVTSYGSIHDSKYVYEFSDVKVNLSDDMTMRERLLIQKVIINENSIEIADGAFSQLQNLKSVDIKGDLKIIGEKAFCNCVNLVNINLPNGLLEVRNMAFEGCTSIQIDAIPDTVEIMGVGVFKGCNSLFKLKLPLALTQISSEAFLDCVNLTELNGMSNIKKIEKDAFKNCISLKEIIFSKEIKSLDNPFVGCSSLTRIIIPNDLDLFDADLSTCSSLKQLYFPKIIDKLKIRNYIRGDWNKEIGKRMDIESPVKIYAFRGSLWKNQVGMIDIIYLNKKEYEEIIENGLIQAGIISQKDELVSTSINYSDSKFSDSSQSDVRINNKTAKQRIPQRASWRTTSVQNVVSDPLPTNSLNFSTFLDSLEKNITAEYECLVVPEVESIIGINLNDLLRKYNANIFIDDVITNKIFTVAFNLSEFDKTKELFVSLIDEKGKLVSNLVNIKLLNSDFSGRVEAQLELNKGINQGSYDVVVLLNNLTSGSVMYSKSINVDISFFIDMDFDF